MAQKYLKDLSNAAPSMEKYGSVHDAMRVGCMGRKRLYQLIHEGVVVALRDGARTIIDLDTVRGRFATLPKAVLRQTNVMKRRAKESSA